VAGAGREDRRIIGVPVDDLLLDHVDTGLSVTTRPA
jgi:hypothetical protein